MPNGGMLPSCIVCKWSEREELPHRDVYCRKHSMTVYGSFHTFCPDLSKDSTPGLALFIQENEIAGSDLYAWIQIGYRSEEYPDLPQYYHEYKLLASLTTYASWNKKEIRARREELYKEALHDFLTKYGPKVE
jgi:hypothetical protein